VAWHDDVVGAVDWLGETGLGNPMRNGRRPRDVELTLDDAGGWKKRRVVSTGAAGKCVPD
jgi:hypothetical protein